MSGQSGSEKTEKPTRKRKENARKEGQIARSNEVNIAFSVILLFAVLYILWDRFIESASKMIGKYLSAEFLCGTSSLMSKTTVTHVYKQALTDGLSIVWPILLLAMLVGVVVHVLQTGLLLTAETLKPKMNRINPLEGFKRIVSPRTLVELLKSTLKVVCLCYFFYSVFSGLIPQFPEMMRMDIESSFAKVMHMALNLAIKMGGVLGAIAALDYFYQRIKHEKDLMMTKQEVKDEYKQIEGDPKIKGKIRQKQRQMSRLRMMRRLPQADVVITNPTHFAVAIQYTEHENRAPVVLAKGKDHMARRIKEKAREYGVEIVENRPVAQALYKNCELEQEIPAELYQAVAEILVYVYRMKNKTAKRRI